MAISRLTDCMSDEESTRPSHHAIERAPEGLMRWSVVPPSFRSLLPEGHKSRDSHDIVLVCVGCYTRCEGAYERHRARVFAQRQVVRDTARFEAEDAGQARSRSAVDSPRPRPSAPPVPRWVLHEAPP